MLDVNQQLLRMRVRRDDHYVFCGPITVICGPITVRLKTTLRMMMIARSSD